MVAKVLSLSAVLCLSGCISFGDMSSFGSSHNVEHRVHQVLPAAGVQRLRIENVSGSIEVSSWNRPNVDVAALEYGADSSELDRTHVEVKRDGTDITVNTRYDRDGGFFFRSSGAQVDYRIQAPANLAITVVNVSGKTLLTGMQGDVEASEISGRLDATLGRVSGQRHIHLTAISGPITARIARASDSKVDASTISGGVNLFFPADLRRGVVGNSATGSLGKGSASLVLHTISGSITVTPM